MEIPQSLLLPLLLPIIGAPVIALWAFVYYRLRQTGNKVRRSDPILRADIVFLARMNSQLLDDAIALYSAQIEHGRDPDA